MYFVSALPSDDILHYGIKGMRWGIRRTPEQLGHKTSIRKQRKQEMETTRNNLRKELRVKYHVDEEYQKANDAWSAYYKKHGYEPADPDAYYKKAEDASRKMTEEVEKRMMQKYGAEYTRMKNSESALATAVVLGGTVASMAALYGSMKLAKAGTAALGKAAVKGGAAVGNIVLNQYNKRK